MKNDSLVDEPKFFSELASTSENMNNKKSQFADLKTSARTYQENSKSFMARVKEIQTAGK